MPFEYTPEITEDFIRRQSRGIQRDTAADVGTARREAIAGGYAADPAGTSAVGLARARGREREANFRSDVGFQVAGLQRADRLIGEQQAYGTSERLGSQSWQSGESAKDREQRERLMVLGYKQDRDMEALGNRRDYQSGLWQVPVYLGAQYLGSKF